LANHVLDYCWPIAQISGPPRTFSSGNRGWYAGGKIQVQVGKKTVWAQIGVNVTIIGSKDWKEK
jgi:hypothetical protein